MLNGVDIALMAFLTLALPIFQLQASVRGLRATPRSLPKRFIRMILMLGVPTLVLGVDWRMAGRSAKALGLGPPTSTGALVGLTLAAVFIVALPIVALMTESRADPAKIAAGRARMAEAGALLGSRRELALFIAMSTLIGVAGEILFRGFLVWAFTPLVGVIGAVIVAALAYGLGHGSRSWRAGLGSLASAFVFTIAYALTLSLWWLILIHVFAGVVGGWSGYRMARA